jgi:hypothetical protein
MRAAGRLSRAGESDGTGDGDVEEAADETPDEARDAARWGPGGGESMARCARPASTGGQTFACSHSDRGREAGRRALRDARRTGATRGVCSHTHPHSHSDRDRGQGTGTGDRRPQWAGNRGRQFAQMARTRTQRVRSKCDRAGASSRNGESENRKMRDAVTWRQRGKGTCTAVMQDALQAAPSRTGLRRAGRGCRAAVHSPAAPSAQTVGLRFRRRQP